MSFLAFLQGILFVKSILDMSRRRRWDQSVYKRECIKWVQVLLKRVVFRFCNAPTLAQNFLDLNEYFPEEIHICVSMLQKDIEKKC